MNESFPPLPCGMRLLGWSGTLPLIAALGAAAVAPDHRSIATAAFIAYGAVILSFLHGARWGRGLAHGAHPLWFVESVIPSLVGFAALLLVLEPGLGLALLAAGFPAWALIDMFDPGSPAAYRRMRTGITALVLACQAGWRLV